MRTIRLLGLGAAVLLLSASTAAYITYEPATAARDTLHSFFAGEVRGDVTARLGGSAEFGVTEDGRGVFTITLGAHDPGGAVIFTRTDGRPLGLGSYVVSDRAEGGEVVRALLVTGPATRPTGAFRGWSGTLTITRVSDLTLEGTFDLHATGFLVRDLVDEGRRITASGSFTAVRSARKGLAAGGR